MYDVLPVYGKVHFPAKGLLPFYLAMYNAYMKAHTGLFIPLSDGGCALKGSIEFLEKLKFAYFWQLNSELPTYLHRRGNSAIFLHSLFSPYIHIPSTNADARERISIFTLFGC